MRFDVLHVRVIERNGEIHDKALRK
jgi:hypothetical protein